MASLTEKEVADLCEKHLNEITIYIGRTLGPEASHEAGHCLLLALRKYDAAKSPNMMASLRYKTRCLVIEAMRSQHGRKGTAKYAANASRARVEDFDGFEDDSSAGSDLDEADDLADALKLINEQRMIRRWLLMGGRAGFTHENMRGLLDVSESEIYSEASGLRELLSSRRLHHAVRRDPPAEN